MVLLTAQKCPTDTLSFTNCAITNSGDFEAGRNPNVELCINGVHRYVFSIKNYPGMRQGEIGFSLPQRKWAEISLGAKIDVQPYCFRESAYIGGITLEADFLIKKSVSSDPCDTDVMAREFLATFPRQAFTVGQRLAFHFLEKTMLSLTVRSMEAVDLNAAATGEASEPKRFPANVAGVLIPNTAVTFEKADGALLNLTGKSKGKTAYRSIINPDWNFEKMGIGGLDKEFSGIFRRAFASRVFPPEFIEQLGMKHVRGILLFGPPGTGKTLMARQIGQMLNAREPKIVNGPQILDKYVGESEANIRKLFADAEEEQKRLGPNSGLHIIIFDEIDAICKQRGSMAGSSTAVHDTVVNQLLSKIDGVESLNNILVIGMTNRRDMIDDALLRPGRLEVQMEISLPDEGGRVQILNIHTARMKQYEKLHEDVDIGELATKTKNFSGAEIEGLVRAAQSSAMNRLVKADQKVQIDPDAVEKMKVGREDFMYALENDIKPAFGHALDQLERYMGAGIIDWGDPVQRILDEGDKLVQKTKGAPEKRGLVSALLEGQPNTGKTALAATIAMNSDFPFMKICSPEDMIGYSEAAKCAKIRKVFDDAYKSPLSVILVDNVERLLDYSPVGPRYSNLVLQALLLLFKQQPPPGRKLLVLATTSCTQMVREMGMIYSFGSVIHVPCLLEGAQIAKVVKAVKAMDPDNPTEFTDKEIDKITDNFSNKSCCVGISKLVDIISLVKQSSGPERLAEFEEKLSLEAEMN